MEFIALCILPSGLRLAPPFAREEALKLEEEKEDEPAKKHSGQGWKDRRANIQQAKAMQKSFLHFSEPLQKIFEKIPWERKEDKNLSTMPFLHWFKRQPGWSNQADSTLLY